MKHLDPEAAALLALGERPDRPAVSDHLDLCAHCRREVDALRETVTVARSSLGEAELVEPPEHVWQSIRNDLDLPAELDAIAVGGSDEVRPHAVAPVSDIAQRRRRRSESVRRFVAPVIASAAAAALVVGAALTWNVAAPRDAGQLLATAQLDALPAWSTSSGSAELAETSEGERVLRVSLAANATGDGFREVWLLTPEIDGLISLGLLDGDSGEFIVPGSVDLDRYSVVDISQEPLDGDPTHSGDSIVRGALGA